MPTLPDTQGCGKYHSASLLAYRKCIGKMRANERKERAERQKAKDQDAKNKDDDFFNPGKKRTKPKEKDSDAEPDAGAA